MPLVFTPEWARAWCTALNASELYRTVAATWRGSVALTVGGDGSSPSTPAVFLDLEQGSCRAARVASADDLVAASYVFEAEPALWKELLSGSGSPVMAIMTGRLRLVRGELSQLLPYAAAAKELLALASAVESVFPADW